MTFPRAPFAVFAIGSILWSIAGTAAAQDPEQGRALYLAHCAQCHGPDGAGNGRLAPELNPQPTDLTALAAPTGRFPLIRAIARIDGSDPLVAHGSPMPMFGGFFEGSLAVISDGEGGTVETTVPIADLVAFLEAIQQP